MMLALMLPRSIRVEWQKKQFAITSLRSRNPQQANTHQTDRKPDTNWQKKSDLMSDLSALNMIEGRSFQISAKIKPCQSLNVMGNSSLFTDRSLWVTHSQSGLNFQSPSHSPSNPTRAQAPLTDSRSDSFIIAIGPGLLWTTVWFVRLVLRLILGRRKTAELNWNEKPEPCVFSHRANTAINLIHSRKSTHNSSHTILLSSLSALFSGVSLRRATC